MSYFQDGFLATRENPYGGAATYEVWIADEDRTHLAMGVRMWFDLSYGGFVATCEKVEVMLVTRGEFDTPGCVSALVENTVDEVIHVTYRALHDDPSMVEGIEHGDDD